MVGWMEELKMSQGWKKVSTTGERQQEELGKFLAGKRALETTARSPSFHRKMWSVFSRRVTIISVTCGQFLWVGREPSSISGMRRVRVGALSASGQDDGRRDDKGTWRQGPQEHVLLARLWRGVCRATVSANGSKTTPRFWNWRTVEH